MAAHFFAVFWGRDFWGSFLNYVNAAMCHINDQSRTKRGDRVWWSMQGKARGASFSLASRTVRGLLTGIN